MTEVVFTRLADGTGALLHLPTMEYFGLNATGTRIWELSASGLAPEAIGQRIAEEYAIAVPEADQVVAEFLGELRDAGLWCR